jgi:2'-5' RNA ligase superfamily
MSSYRPFIDDPRDIARLEGQRYVVLRPIGAVADVHRQVRALAKERLGCEISCPAGGHVTLAGFPRGTDLDDIRELVEEWARTMAPLRIEIERVHHFPSPFQIVIVRVRKTRELFDALTSLRERARERRLPGLSSIQAADWVFHMSVAYCASLSASDWAEVSRFFDTLSVPAAQCVVGEVEIAAFDKGAEHQGGVFELSALPPAREPKAQAG